MTDILFARPTRRSSLVFILLAVAFGCSPGEIATRDSAGAVASRSESVPASAQPSPPDTSHRSRPGYVVDSILPLEEELRRFRVGLGDPPAALTGGASSREALVRRFFSALSAADTAGLRAMALSRAEFAFLVYPSSPYTRPPYRQSPELVWLQLQSSGAPGLSRLLDRARSYRYIEHHCHATPAREEQNRLWRQCQTKVVRAAGDTASVRMFGVIVERAGRYKFANFETDF